MSLGIVAAGGECVIVDLGKCGWEQECEAALFGRDAISCALYGLAVLSR